ncbi:MAG: MBL fold metallo-hydrolase [Candidatus Dormibacteraeota bacterium]|uniref:MBL fold metallo-hydrolase n=2 Tax=Candidatus Dormiibacter inghamiae TaxID=3127013 RepID=A0A934KLN6_9BACT|nr:MBL fold metallo-hydrolase [Candidatus Dormibacteraeota bacterium]MBJ7604792.1 MBL fold metallo-hydrolase [Candidatus Dormibacteraeota bacterium]
MACSGFLLEHEDFRLVLDLGYGTLPRLLGWLGNPVADGLDAVAITHKHPDHMVDLHGLFRARWFDARTARPLPVYAPGGVVERVAGLEEDDAGHVRSVFDWRRLPNEPYTVGPFQLESTELPHFVSDIGLRLTAAELTVAYTGDCGPDPGLADLGRDADLYIVEATDRDQQPATPPALAGRQLHLSGRDAGAAAMAAGARRLLLTHFWPGNDRERSRALAAEAYPGPIFIAEEGLRLALP